MSEDRPKACPFRDEMTALVGSVQASTDLPSREISFEALSRLERMALIGGASDGTLRDIAEARFLVGILRDAVRPPKPASLRTILRAREPSARPRPSKARLDPV